MSEEKSTPKCEEKSNPQPDKIAIPEEEEKSYLPPWIKTTEVYVTSKKDKILLDVWWKGFSFSDSGSKRFRVKLDVTQDLVDKLNAALGYCNKPSEEQQDGEGSRT